MKFTQEEIESQLSDAVPHGTRKDLAARTGLYASVVSGWFNPNDERKSPQFTTLFVQADLDNNEPEVGDAVWAVICRIREANKQRASVVGPRDLITAVLDEIRSAAASIQESSAAIADGNIDRRESERLITALHHLQNDTGELLKGLHGRLGDLADDDHRRDAERVN